MRESSDNILPCYLFKNGAFSLLHPYVEEGKSHGKISKAFKREFQTLCLAFLDVPSGCWVYLVCHHQMREHAGSNENSGSFLTDKELDSKLVKCSNVHESRKSIYLALYIYHKGSSPARVYAPIFFPLLPVGQ
ncbi:hypothetical protein STEG23_031044, partial [Scotinomys teguina]